MTAVLAVLAFVMAFGAIWFTTEVLKRVDSRNEAWLKPHLRKINAAVDQNHETLLALKKRMDQLDHEVRMLKLKAELPAAVEQETADIRQGLDENQRFTPSIRLAG